MNAARGDTMQFHAMVWPDAGQFSIVFVDAPGCQTCTDSRESVEAMAQDAVEGWVEAHLVTGTALPAPRTLRRRRPPKGGWWLTVTIPLKIAVRAALVTRRVQMRLSQSQMAARMHVTRQAYQQLESPDANLRLDTLTRAFDALDVAPIISLIPRLTRSRLDLRALARATSKQKKSAEVDSGPPRGRDAR